MKINISKENIELIQSKKSIKEISNATGIDPKDIKAYRQLLKSKPLDDSFEKGVVLFDIHYPDHDQKAIDIALQFVEDLRPSYFVLAGDQMDMATISSFNKHKILLLEKKRLKEDYRGFQKDILDKFENILPNDCKKFYIIGNHDMRTQWLIEKYPQFQGFIEIEDNLELDDWKIIPYNCVCSIGNMDIIHGEFYNIHHARKTLNIYGDNVFYGHTHTSQIFSQTTKIGNKPKQATAVGAMCNLNPEYRKDKANAWIHQFMHFSMFKDGTFNAHINTIINGRCEINGKVYS